MVLNKKQTEALDLLESKEPLALCFGGGAGSSKSFLGCYWIAKMCMKYPGTRYLIGRARLSTLKSTTLLSFFKVCSMQGLKSDEHYKYNAQDNTIKFYNGSMIFLKDLFFYPNDPLFDSLGSLEITGAFLDEAQQLTETAFEIVRTRIRYELKSYGLTPKILLTCNPGKNFLYKRFYLAKKEGNLKEEEDFLQALASDNPDIDPHYISNLMKSPKAIRDKLLYGKWETHDENSLVEYESILNIFTNTHCIDLNATHYITCDVARMGSDKAVIMVWRGFEVIDIKSFDTCTITELADCVNVLKNKYRVVNNCIIADENGIGGGLIDILKIKGFINNARAENGENYQNLKTQCYYKLSSLINDNNLYISYDVNSEEEKAIIEELEQVKSSDNDSDGKIKMMCKSDVKLAIGRSPDYSDSLMMRMFFELKPKITKYRIR